MEKSLDILWERVSQERIQRKLQAKEYKRRLRDLNGEAGRLKGMQDTYLRKDTYDTNVQTQSDKFQKSVEQVDLKYDALVRELRKELKEISDWKTAQSGNVMGKNESRDKFDKYIPWVFSIIMAVFAYLMYKK